ncbi:UbiA family prenyltransferase [Roseibacillus persicicus]|uniref:UbiA family prenyltransferase n=1 Tax=Roseibacillus persicicus TaxID=454148 RepID=UPI00280CE64C|nr:UbiA family prenyltransferase [Roseibacillus persicicus]MDQ8188868.1 UbiA family prenyltransferase [Roseibacillus persicicus]
MEWNFQLRAWVQMLRPNHWVKSGFCLAALFFGGRFLSVESWLLLLPLLVSISLLSSAGYIVNDCLNLEEDRHHPRKRRRPIASGEVGVKSALLSAGILTSFSLFLLCYAYGVKEVFFLSTGYLILTCLYSVLFRSIPVLDVMTLSIGFVVRVISGAYAVGLPPTWWLVGCTYSLALLLGFGKRRGELVLFRKRGENVGGTRKALKGYSFLLLDSLLAASALACVGTYVAFVVVRGNFFLGLSIVPVLSGVSDYIRMAWRSEVVETPETLFLRSPVLLSSVGGWLACVLFSQLGNF